jgi:hypothetical protein
MFLIVTGMKQYQPAIDRYQNEVKRLFGVMDVSP